MNGRARSGTMWTWLKWTGASIVLVAVMGGGAGLRLIESWDGTLNRSAVLMAIVAAFIAGTVLFLVGALVEAVHRARLGDASGEAAALVDVSPDLSGTTANQLSPTTADSTSADDDNNPFRPPSSAALGDPSVPASAPALRNPNAAALWALVMGLPCAALLHALNWHKLGEPRRAAVQWGWAIGSVILVLSLGFVPAAEIPLISGLQLGALLIWYAATARGQVRYVESRYDGAYRRRRWVIPIVLGLVFSLILGLLAERIAAGM